MGESWCPLSHLGVSLEVGEHPLLGLGMCGGLQGGGGSSGL